jgi:hypothetical protein
MGINNYGSYGEEVEVFAAIVVNVAISWFIAPCGLYVNRRFGGIFHVYLLAEDHTFL